MKRLQVNTTQNVKINFELAHVGLRLGAFVIDNILKFAYVYFVMQLFNLRLLVATEDGWSVKAVTVVLILPVTLYSLYQEVLMNGQTLGKRALKIRVITKDGFKPSFTDYLIRWFLRIADFNLFFLIGVYVYALGMSHLEALFYVLFFMGKMIGFFMILFTKNNQRIGDFAANTTVVTLKDEVKFSHTILENISETYKPKFAAVIKLSDNDARIIKDTYRKARKTKDYKTIKKLKLKVEEVTGITAENLTDFEFIDIVLKDYNYYTQNM